MWNSPSDMALLYEQGRFDRLWLSCIGNVQRLLNLLYHFRNSAMLFLTLDGQMSVLCERPIHYMCAGLSGTIFGSSSVTEIRDECYS
jgi:hypothetical protein